MKYINKLTNAQEKELLSILGFDKYLNNDKFEIKKSNFDTKIGYSAFNWDYGNDVIYINDFYVNEGKKEETKALRIFLYNIFGEQYMIDLIEHLGHIKEGYKEKLEKQMEEVNKTKKDIDKIDNEIKEVEKLEK